MLRLQRMSNSGEAVVRRLACGLSTLALAISMAGPGSLAADAQNEALASIPGAFQLAAHSGAPYYQPYYQSYIQPNYRIAHRTRPRPHRTRPRPRRRYRRKRVTQPTPPPAKWYPSEESKDPIQIIVSLPKQQLTVYKGGKPLITSRLSSGKPGFSTPSGVFSILQKNRVHFSNIYRGAPMPFMQRLTWSGIAFHGSNSVPVNRPASHGCIRLPHAFARQLFKFTEKGAHVVVANEDNVEPIEIAHDNLFRPFAKSPKDFDRIEEEWIARRGGIKIEEEEKSTSPIRVLVTRRTGRELFMEMQSMLNELSFGAGDVDGWMGPDTAKAIRRFQKTYALVPNGAMSQELIDKLYEVLGKGKPLNGHLYVRQDFNPVFDVPVFIKEDEKPLGSHMYTAMHFEPDAEEVRWLAVTLTKGSGSNAAYGRKARKKNKKPVEDIVLTEIAPEASTAQEALSRIEIPQQFRQRINRMLTPGSSLAITNDGISRETTPKGTDFIVLMQ